MPHRETTSSPPVCVHPDREGGRGSKGGRERERPYTERNVWLCMVANSLACPCYRLEWKVEGMVWLCFLNKA